MNAKTEKLLLDVREASDSILNYTSGKSLSEYCDSRLLRRAVEREFEIIGEALNRIGRTDPAAAACISQLRKIVTFRNRVIHGYDTVDDTVVWGVIQSHLPPLLREVPLLLDEGAPTDNS